MLTTQFFAMKIQRYMAEHGISESTLAKVARGVRERRPQPQRLAPPAALRGRGARLQDGQPPADAVHVLLAGRGRGRRSCWRAGERARLRARARVSALGRLPHPPLRFLRGVQPVDPDHRAPSPTTEAAAAAFEQAGIGPEDVDVAQLQDTESGAEHGAPRRDGPARTASRSRYPERRHPARRPAACQHRRRLPRNGEPIGASGLRQVHEIVLQLRGEALASARSPGRRVGFTQVYGAPGVSACTVLSV